MRRKVLHLLPQWNVTTRIGQNYMCCAKKTHRLHAMRVRPLIVVMFQALQSESRRIQQTLLMFQSVPFRRTSQATTNIRCTHVPLTW